MVGYGANALSLKDKTSRQRVLLLVRTSLAGGVWMSEVNASFFECIRKTTELTVVVTGDTLENLSKVIAIPLAQRI